MSDPIVVLVTAGSQEEAQRIADALVQERLAACASIVPRIMSVYRWEGKLHHDEEWLLLVKSSHELLDQLVQSVEAKHSYEVPEIIALPTVGGSDRYLRWLAAEVRQG